MITRRTLLKTLAFSGVASFTLGSYAVAEALRFGVTRYAVSPPGWPEGLSLRLAILTDLHVCEPWLGIDRLRHIVAETNALRPDAVLLLGDYVPGAQLLWFGQRRENAEWAAVLAGLKAPLGVHAVLGNHDWWEDIEVQRRRSGPVPAGVALVKAGIPVYENDAVRLEKEGHPFWIAGLGDQWAFWPRQKPDGLAFRGDAYEGVDDLAGTLARITDDAPVILMIHEPDIFPEVPARVALTVAGHTHGGQVRVLGYAPVVPSRYGQRYLVGHIVEEDRNLIVSAGLGCSKLPIRLGAPPEIVLVTVETGHTYA
ncbi:metallophosphoesterase [Hyphomicrobium sp.]|uniref:metallophosphoesterase n=1 Tax=Hyphomicrobium sp. TaxID=82 RepID=UPI002FDFC352